MGLNENEIVVSVCMITYNHASFIAQAIDGVVMQQTNFRYELIISEDCSTDNTRDVCKAYQLKYPDKIKLILPAMNLGVIKNSLSTFQACKGKYIAICEGDDYWVDPFKLQKQVDFLEANPDYGLVHTNYNVVDKENHSITTYNRLPSNYTLLSDVFELYLRGKYGIASLTVLFRRVLFEGFVDELKSIHLKMTDLPMWLEFSKKSKVSYMDEISASYRMLKNSASHSEDVVKSLNFELNKLEVTRYFANKYGIIYDYKKVLSKYYSNLLKECYNNNNKELATSFYAKMVELNFVSVLNPRPLLFLLAVNYSFFDKIILQLKQSRFSSIKKHL